MPRVVAGHGRVSAATWRPASIREPRYTGLLASAPTAIGSAEQIITNFSQYRLALGQLVGNVVQLYDVTSTLPTYRASGSTIALLHISDLHLNPAGIDLVTSLVTQFHVQGVIDSGDVTDHGSAAEEPFVDDLRRIQVPYVVIKGNHDSATTIEQIERLPNATVLDRSATTLAGITIAGIADPRFTPDKTSPADDGRRGDLRAAARGLPRPAGQPGQRRRRPRPDRRRAPLAGTSRSSSPATCTTASSRSPTAPCC